MNRVLTVARLQLINRQTFIWVPLMVLGGALVICLLIFWIVPADNINAGGAQAPLWYFAVVGVQALTLTFPFSQAMSITRRDFLLGTLLTAASTALMLTALFVAGGIVEGWTDGYGGNHTFFRVPSFWDEGWAGAGFIHFVIAMGFFLVGFCFATIYKRSGPVIFTAVLIGLALLLVAGLWVIGQRDAWTQVGDWIATQGTLGMSFWAVPLLIAMIAVSYGLLRRTVP